MNHEVKKKWLEALRSGKYEQGRGALLSVNGGNLSFCCLGVLCDLYTIEHPGEVWEMPKMPDKPGYATLLGMTVMLPDEVTDWAELDDTDPTVISLNFGERSLSVFNDGAEDDIPSHTFYEIADMIEAAI